MRYFLNFLVCVLSIYHPVFIPFQLLFLVLKSIIIQDVFFSFYKNGQAFLITILLGIVVLLIYSGFGFFFLQTTFGIDDDNLQYYTGYIQDSDNQKLCDSYFECFLNFFNFGIRNGGGIGDLLSKYYDIDAKYFTGRVLFDLFFFFLLIVILLNLIFGILINTFSGIRDELFQNKKDQMTKCFICDIEKASIDKKGSGFDYHVKNEHNMWDYIFYIIYLKEKGEDDLNLFEDYIWNNYKKKSYDFLPFMSPLCINTTEESAENTQQILKKINLIADKFSNSLIEVTQNPKIKKTVNMIEKQVKLTFAESSILTTSKIIKIIKFY